MPRARTSRRPGSFPRTLPFPPFRSFRWRSGAGRQRVARVTSLAPRSLRAPRERPEQREILRAAGTRTRESRGRPVARRTARPKARQRPAEGEYARAPDSPGRCRPPAAVPGRVGRGPGPASVHRGRPGGCRCRMPVRSAAEPGPPEGKVDRPVRSRKQESREEPCGPGGCRRAHCSAARPKARAPARTACRHRGHPTHPVRRGRSMVLRSRPIRRPVPPRDRRGWRPRARARRREARAGPPAGPGPWSARWAARVRAPAAPPWGRPPGRRTPPAAPRHRKPPAPGRRPRRGGRPRRPAARPAAGPVRWRRAVRGSGRP